MSFQLKAKSLSDETYSEAHFGANVLGLRDRIGEDGTFDDVVDHLSVDHLRYPGGSLTEDLFNLSDPDSEIATSHTTGEEVEIMPISEIFGFAETQGLGMTLVLPTRMFIGEEVDAHGNRLPDIDEETLRGFLRDLFDGKFGSPDLQAIELGSEYWGSGEMNSFEYGRLAADMAVIVNEEITAHPNAELFTETDVLVQMGLNYGSASLSDSFDGSGQEQLAALNETYGLTLAPDVYLYSSGNVAWAKVANAIIVNEFDTAAEQDAIDAVVGHIYSKGADAPNSRYFELSQISDTWGEEFPELDIYISEWNLKRSVSEERETEFGLKQAHEMLNLMEAFAWGSVDAANVWPLQMDSRTGLANTDGDIRVPGEMFRLMEQTLPGMRPLTLTDSQGRETEIEDETADAHVFYSPDRLVTFLASTSDTASQETVDFSELVTTMGEVTITRLGVAEGESPTHSAATPSVTQENPADLIENGILIANLAPHEILMIEMSNPTYSSPVEALAATLPVIPEITQGADPDPDEPLGDTTASPAGTDEDPDPELPPTLPASPEDEPLDADPEPSTDEHGGGFEFGFGAIALALLPLLLLVV
ncbi:hypothetical protein ACSSVY_001029 [Roseovarius sp. MBR-51]